MTRLSGQVHTDQLAPLQEIKQFHEDSPAGEAKQAEPGWYPNAYGWARLQYWDGERWTQRYRTTPGNEQESGEKEDPGEEPYAGEEHAGEKEECSGESPAVQDTPVLEAHALFWQRTRVIVSLPREPVRLNPVGIGLTFIGAALMIIGVFLPRVESQQFFKVPDNTLIQSGDGWIFIGLAVFIAVAVFAAIHGRRRTYAVLVFAALGIGVATYVSTGERLDLSSLNPAAAAVLGSTEKTSPGTGLYTVGAGSGLAALGGLLLTGIGSQARTRLAHWEGPLWTAVKDWRRIGEVRHGVRATATTATPEPGS